MKIAEALVYFCENKRFWFTSVKKQTVWFTSVKITEVLVYFCENKRFWFTSVKKTDGLVYI